MHKLLPTVTCLLVLSVAQAQIPAGYYDSAYIAGTPRTCADLKTILFRTITRDTANIPYNSQNNALFDTRAAVNKIDIHRNDANTANIIWDMYTDNPTGPELYTFTPITNQCGNYSAVGDCYNREHSFPVAWFGDVQPMRTDMHHIFGTDGYTNGKHDNYPYGEVGFADWQSPAGAKLGTCSFGGYTGKVFEPIDEYKGDFARAMFYMVTAYEDFMPSWQSNSSADAVLNGTTWPSLDNWAIQQWYKWHIQDPVSQKEIDRNDSIYTFQHNRNPYIDHPEFVALVWQCTNLLPVTVLDFTAVNNNNSVSVKWTVNREINFRQYEVERSIDGVSFSQVGIVSARQLENYSFTDNQLPAAKTLFYRLKMVDADGRSSYSKTATVRLNLFAGGVLIYPNPAVNEITVSISQQILSHASLRITDITGRELYRQSVNQDQSTIKIKTSSLSTGKYFMLVSTDSDIYYSSFLIVR